MIVAELLEAVNQQSRPSCDEPPEPMAVLGASHERGRYIAIERLTYATYESWIDDDGIARHRAHDNETHEYRLYGGAHVYTYKRLRNALKVAGEGGFVCVLDISHLPIVDPDAVANGVDDKNEIDEYALAERQLLIWEQRVRELKAKQGKAT